VIWTPAAEQNLATVWMDAHDRNAVTSAASIVDQLLAQEPETQGEVRFDTIRSFAVPPLGVDFEIVEADRMVYVLSAWDVTKENH